MIIDTISDDMYVMNIKGIIYLFVIILFALSLTCCSDNNIRAAEIEKDVSFSSVTNILQSTIKSEVVITLLSTATRNPPEIINTITLTPTRTNLPAQPVFDNGVTGEELAVLGFPPIFRFLPLNWTRECNFQQSEVFEMYEYDYYWISPSKNCTLSFISSDHYGKNLESFISTMKNNSDSDISSEGFFTIADENIDAYKIVFMTRNGIDSMQYIFKSKWALLVAYYNCVNGDHSQDSVIDMMMRSASTEPR